MEEFILTENHLKLIKKFNIRWEDDFYEGAPSVDVKRPYGNSQPYNDIAEIIGIEKIKVDCGEEYFPKGTRDICIKLHEEMATALQICCFFLEFKTGVFVREHAWSEWKKQDSKE